MRVTVVEQGFRKRHPYKAARDALFRPYWFPVENAADELRDLMIRVTFARALSEDALNCDVIIMSSRTVDAMVAAGEFDCRGAACHKAGSRGARVVWFDTRDSTGNCQFDVMPHVEIYLKRQILRDRSLYLQPTYYGRVFSDFYSQNFGVDDGKFAELAGSGLTSGGETHAYRADEVMGDLASAAKMRAAWGCGAEFHWPQLSPSDMPRYMACRAIQNATRAGGVSPVTRSPQSMRELDVASLFDETRYGLASVGFQRKLALDHTRALMGRAIAAGRVGRKEFYSTLAASKITVSTFGWGEVCFREYEATYCGSAILMADMSHLETYPDLYRPGETYVPFRWDLSDFEARVDEMLADPQSRIARAEAAQQLLLEQWTKQGRQAFALRFAGLLAAA